jgi:hypothetical protein
MQLLPSQYAQLQMAGGDTTIGSTTAGFMANARVELVNSNSIQLNGSTPLASVSPLFGGYDGYAADSINWQAPGVNQAGIVEAIGIVATFRPTDATNPVNMWGVAMRDLANANLLFAAPFDTPPYPMQSTLNSITLTLSFQPATCNIVVTLVS